MMDTQRIVLSVPDVSCAHCEKTINGTLGELAGVASVATDIPTKTVQVAFDPSQVTLEQIEATLDEIGYTVAKA